LKSFCLKRTKQDPRAINQESVRIPTQKPADSACFYWHLKNISCKINTLDKAQSKLLELVILIIPRMRVLAEKPERNLVYSLVLASPSDK
jgi:hypothetical protein